MLPWRAGKPLLLFAIAAIGACGGQTASPRVDEGGSGNPADGGERFDGADSSVDAQGRVDAEGGIICTANNNGGSSGGSEHAWGERETCSNGQTYSYWAQSGIADDGGGSCLCDCCLNSQCGYGVQPNATAPCPDLAELPDGGSLSPQQFDDAFFAACGYPY